MDPELKWVIGIAVSLSTAFTAAIIGAFRSLAGRISQSNKDLHTRVDDVKEKYVRRDDLDNHIRRIEKGIDELKKENQQNHKQVMEILASRK